jgi:hypothetical protein
MEELMSRKLLCDEHYANKIRAHPGWSSSMSVAMNLICEMSGIDKFDETQLFDGRTIAEWRNMMYRIVYYLREVMHLTTQDWNCGADSVIAQFINSNCATNFMRHILTGPLSEAQLDRIAIECHFPPRETIVQKIRDATAHALRIMEREEVVLSSGSVVSPIPNYARVTSEDLAQLSAARESCGVPSRVKYVPHQIMRCASDAQIISTSLAAFEHVVDKICRHTGVPPIRARLTDQTIEVTFRQIAHDNEDQPPLRRPRTV